LSLYFGETTIAIVIMYLLHDLPYEAKMKRCL